jgi:Domain of unknown function (DUF305)
VEHSSTSGVRPAGAADGSVTRADPPAWRGEHILVLLGVSVIVGVGVALIALLVTRPPGDVSPEAGFAQDMSAHHAQAVEMAEIVRDRTESEEVRILAKDIVLTQQAQIGMMQKMLEEMGAPPVEDVEPMSMEGGGHAGGHHGE